MTAFNELLAMQALNGQIPQGMNPMGVNVPATQNLWQRGPQSLLGANAPGGGGIQALMGNPLFGLSMGLLSA